LNLLELNSEFSGSFWPAGNKAASFFGVLSITFGSTISFRFVGVQPQTIADNSHLHGHLTIDGKVEDCTLLNLTFSETLLSCGGSGVVSCESVVLGRTISPENRYEEATFAFTNQLPFFYQRPDFESIVDLDTHFIDFEIEGDLYSDFIGHKFNISDIKAHAVIHCSNKDALDDLQLEIDRIREKYDDPAMWLAYDKQHSIKIKFSKCKSVSEIYEHTEAIMQLFALIYRIPVFIKTLTVDHQPKLPGMKIIPSVFTRNEVLERAKESVLGRFLTITNSNIDFHAVLSKWLAVRTDHSLVISAIQNNDGAITEDELFGKYALLALQLESINTAIGGVHKTRYQNPVDNYADIQMVQVLNEYVKHAGLSSIGDLVSHLRNAMTHEKSSKKTYNKFSRHQLINLSKLLVSGEFFPISIVFLMGPDACGSTV